MNELSDSPTDPVKVLQTALKAALPNFLKIFSGIQTDFKELKELEMILTPFKKVYKISKDFNYL